MQNQYIFKKFFFGGYSKIDVDEYIEKLNNEKNNEINNLKAKITELENENATAITQSKLDELINEKNSEINLMKKQIEEFEYFSRVYRDKSNKYDEISDKVDAIISDANGQANNMLLEAKDKAKKIEDISKLKEEKCKEHIQNILIKAKEEYKILFEYISSIEADFKIAFEKVDSRISDIKQKLTNITTEEIKDEVFEEVKG